jgi:hypothetical protein
MAIAFQSSRGKQFKGVPTVPFASLPCSGCFIKSTPY